MCSTSPNIRPCFEMRATDLAGRIGKLRTKSGTLETPALLPVVHPVKQEIHPRVLMDMGFEAVMTNAYLALKYLGREAVEKGIHRSIGFEKIVMTDSGGYQVLEYGQVKTDPKEITKFQEDADSDIAMVLDRPTGYDVPRSFAEKTVKETIKAAKLTISTKVRRDVLWAGPIQGGRYLDLVARSSKRLVELGFNIFALGSPTEVMEAYDFKLLMDMIVTAKLNLPPDKPLHLFGAGHPLTIPLAIALGCDTFDSASYMLYAKDDRYMTDHGTVKLKDLSYLECSCSICVNHTSTQLKTLSKNERVEKLALHNLHVLRREVEASKQALEEGRLWDYVGLKARAHPKLWEAYTHLQRYISYLEEGTPLFKRKGLSFFDYVDQRRPEVERHNRRLLKDLKIPFERMLLILVPETEARPFERSSIYRQIDENLGENRSKAQVCSLSHAFGVVPMELSSIYPLSQYVSCLHVAGDVRIEDLTLKRLGDFLARHRFQRILAVNSSRYYEPLIRSLPQRFEGCVIIDVEDLAKLRVFIENT